MHVVQVEKPAVRAILQHGQMGRVGAVVAQVVRVVVHQAPLLSSACAAAAPNPAL